MATLPIEEAYKAAETPIRDFMYGQTQEKDLHLFMDIDGEDYPDQMTLELYYDVPMTTVTRHLSSANFGMRLLWDSSFISRLL